MQCKGGLINAFMLFIKQAKPFFEKRLHASESCNVLTLSLKYSKYIDGYQHSNTLSLAIYELPIYKNHTQACLVGNTCCLFKWYSHYGTSGTHSCVSSAVDVTKCARYYGVVLSEACSGCG